MATAAADWIERHAAPRRLVALAVGRSVEQAYRELVRRGTAGRLQAVTIDELHPLPRGDARAFGARAERVLGIRLVERFDPAASDPDREARRVERVVRRRGLETTVLGLGPNGHLAMNEPGERLDAGARYVPLSRSTVSHLGGRRAIAPAIGGMTLGLPTLLSAAHVLLVVLGPTKRSAFERMIVGPLTTKLPASVLRLHPDLTVLCTTAEARALPGIARVVAFERRP